MLRLNRIKKSRLNLLHFNLDYYKNYSNIDFVFEIFYF